MDPSPDQLPSPAVPSRANTPREAGLTGATPAPESCTHCGQPLGGGESDGFCCHGCRSVYHALRDGGLDRYYSLRDGPGVPVGELGLERRDHSWLEPYETQLAQTEGTTDLRWQIQGVRCAACVWLVQQLMERAYPEGQAIVSPGSGGLQLTVGPDFPARRFVDAVESVGYLLGPPSEDTHIRRDDLLLRTGTCVALALNSMMFSAAIYLGLEHGPLHRFLQGLNFAAAALSVMIGGPVFINAALQAIRQRVLHLDVPIALAIVLTFAAATWSYATGNARAAYHDSLAVFVALMLVGRYLQERVLSRNREEMLRGDGVDTLSVQCLVPEAASGGGGVHPRRVLAREVEAGDDLLVAPGELVPLASTLQRGEASCSLDWINGESAPRRFSAGERVPAGAFNVGSAAIELRAEETLASSALLPLLREPIAAQRSPGLLAGFAPWYVLAVLAAAAAGLVHWTLSTGELVKGLEVATAVLVVTCPCAIGIATPLAFELAHAGLRRAGLFVRRADFLSRAVDVRQVFFDKTGTLTTGRLSVENPSALDALDPDDRRALYNMVTRSLHPQSLALRSLLQGPAAGAPPAFDVGQEVIEHPGRGLSMRGERGTYQLGSAAWVGATGEGDLCLARDGELLCRLRTVETERPGAAAELARLQAQGLRIYVLSGDDPARVRALADRVGLPADRVHGAMSPADKARFVETRGQHDCLMVGDGINDSLAVQRAHCSGTPSIDRSFMPDRVDFYFVTPGLAPIGLSLRVARRLARTVRTNTAAALLYNVGAVALALGGLMQPWVAALLMPLSSLGIVGLTLGSLSPRSALWKS